MNARWVEDCIAALVLLLFGAAVAFAILRCS